MSRPMSKAALASHLGLPHGGTQHIEPIKERMRWSKDELESAHAHLLTYGPCNTHTRAVGQ